MAQIEIKQKETPPVTFKDATKFEPGDTVVDAAGNPAIIGADYVIKFFKGQSYPSAFPLKDSMVAYRLALLGEIDITIKN